MTASETIVFHFRTEMVPALVVETALAKTPAGFELVISDDADSDAERREKLARASYVVAYGVPFDDFDAIANVKLFQLLSAGFDRLDIERFEAMGIPVANNGGANAPTVAEHAVMLMLGVYRKLPLHHRALGEGEWLGHRHALDMFELRGKQIGIVGFGRIGQDIARIVAGFLATPVYFDVKPASAEVESALGARRFELDELLRTSDIVTLHTPLNAATDKLIDAAALAKMKRSAVLINTSRGPVVEEAALVAALDAGTIAGAGLDVFEREPIAAGNPLLGRDNVVVTPHTAGTTIDTWWRRLEFAFGNVQAVARGEPARSTVR